jgi:hypothetical protein
LVLVLLGIELSIIECSAVLNVGDSPIVMLRSIGNDDDNQIINSILCINY